jgi:hypothetical protein
VTAIGKFQRSRFRRCVPARKTGRAFHLRHYWIKCAVLMVRRAEAPYLGVRFGGDLVPASERTAIARSSFFRCPSTTQASQGAAMPAEKRAAAAPSMAPFPPPATSCRAPNGSPPPGSRESTTATPKGSTVVAHRCRPSICRTRTRRDSRADGGRTAEGVLHGHEMGSCSLFVLDRGRQSQGHFRLLAHVLKWPAIGRTYIRVIESPKRLFEANLDATVIRTSSPPLIGR